MKQLVVKMIAAVLAVWTLTFPISANKGGAGSARLNLVEATVPDLLKAIQTGLVTIEQLVQMYHARMDAYDDAGPGLNAYLHRNANAEGEARQLDALRHPGRERSPLYGIPVLLKDNIDTADMPTTAGSVALEGSIPPNDAFITLKLREAGAIILGKATLTEFANFIANGMPTGYSSLGGFGFNPYDPRDAPRRRRPAGAADGRIELRLGHRREREPRGRRDRHRDLGIDSQSGERQRRGRHQAHRGAGQPRRHHPDHRGPGHGRTDRAHGDGCGHRARRDRRLRSRGSRDRRVPHARQLLQRLHEVPRQEGAQEEPASPCRPSPRTGATS